VVIHPDTFVVRIHEKSQSYFGDHESVNLTIDKNGVKISSHNDVLLVSWKYKDFRKYGFSDTENYYYFKTGKSAQFGEGTFKFVTSKVRFSIGDW